MCVGGVVFTVPARGQGEGISQRPTGEEKGRAGLNEIFMWLFFLFFLFSVPEPVDAANPSTPKKYYFDDAGDPHHADWLPQREE